MNSHREGNLAIAPQISNRATRTKWTEAKRQEWRDEYLAARQEPPALSLGERGLIRDCSKSLEILFGFRRSDLVWQPVTVLFPQLAGIELVREGEVNPMLNYLFRCGQLYQSQNRQGELFSCHLSLFRLEYDGTKTLRMIVRPMA